MSTSISSFVEVKNNEKWEKINEDYSPFDWTSYSLFGFLAGIRNYSHCTPISEPKGLPKDSEFLNSISYYEYYYMNQKAHTNKDEIEESHFGCSYLTLEELLSFDYDKTFWDRRVMKQTSPNVWNGASLAEEGEGEIISYRQHLGEAFFNDLEKLKTFGESENVRVVFYFC